MHNACFEIQRSADGRTFEVAGHIQGHGSTPQASTYQFTDATLGALATAYYRLRQVDTDGSFSFSPGADRGAGAERQSATFSGSAQPRPGRSLAHTSQLYWHGPYCRYPHTDRFIGPAPTHAGRDPAGTTDLGLDAAVAPGAYWLLLSEPDGPARQSTRVLIIGQRAPRPLPALALRPRAPPRSPSGPQSQPLLSY